MAHSPYRNDGVTIAPGATVACPRCGQPFAPLGRQRFCSAACCQGTWRRRHSPAAAVPPVVPPGVSRAATVYECPACGTRLLGEQRCADCNVFCRRVGPGGPCPHCEEPVAVADLLGISAGSASPVP